MNLNHKDPLAGSTVLAGDVELFTEYNFMKHLGAGIGVESTRIYIDAQG